PIRGIAFTEPPPDSEPTDSKPTQNTTGQLTPEVLQRVKEATVYLRVRSSEGDSEGSGFFGGEAGGILTNAHRSGLLERNAREPTSVRVVRNKGEKNETTIPARVVAVDRDADLALLSVRDPRGGPPGMPEPLLIKSAQHLRETQPVFVAGFPLGELP